MDDLLLKDNYFKNWHKPKYHAVTHRKPLSELWPATAHINSKGGAQINFTDGYGKEISFYLTKEALDLLKRKLAVT